MERILDFSDIKLFAYNTDKTKIIVSDSNSIKLLQNNYIYSISNNGESIIKIMFDINNNILILTNKSLTIYNTVPSIIMTILSNDINNNSKYDFVYACINQNNNPSTNGTKLALIHQNSSIDIYDTSDYTQKLIFLNSSITGNRKHANVTSKINLLSFNDDLTQIVYEEFYGLVINIYDLTRNNVKKIDTLIPISTNRRNRINKYCIFSIDNQHILEIYKNEIKYFNINTNELDKITTFESDFIIVSPDQKIVLGIDSLKIKLFDINTSAVMLIFDNAFNVYKAVFSQDGEKVACLSSENIAIINIRQGIINSQKLSNMIRVTLTRELILTNPDKKILEKFVAKLLSNYNFFKLYLENNNLQSSFNSRNFMNIILTTGLNINQNDFSIFLNNLIKFINSIPYSAIYLEPDNVIIKYYLNIMHEYLLYLYYQFNTESHQSRDYSRFRITVRLNHELEDLLSHMTNPNVYLTKKIYIEYREQTGINSGGLTRSFLTNLEIILNTELLLDLDLEKKIDILAISKLNGNPITIINDETFKINIIKIIISYFKNNLKKNIAYNLLLNNKIETTSSIILYGFKNGNNVEIENSEELFNKSLQKVYKLNIERLNIKSNFKANSSNSRNQNINLKQYIDVLIRRNIYINYLDFYLSHFLEVKVNKNMLLSRLSITNRTNISGTVFDFETFKQKFIKLINTLNDEELILFNRVISGSNLLQKEYKILVFNVHTSNTMRMPRYHTCFSTMDIESYKSFLRHYLRLDSNNEINISCKDNFIHSLNISMEAGLYE